MEPSASIAHWDGDELTLYETTQWVVGARNTVAETLRMPEENVHIVSPFIGGGFGCKGFIWPHSVMSAIAAKKVGRPVKLNLTRKQMFSGCGHRSETRQKVSLGASRDGKLSAIKHETLVQTSASARRLKRMESRCDGMAVCAWISSKRLVPMNSSRTRSIVQRPPTTAGDRAIGHTLSPIESICRIALWRLKRSASSPKPPVDATIHVSNQFPILTGWRTTAVTALGRGLSATQAGC
jgi:hypothetical protein